MATCRFPISDGERLTLLQAAIQAESQGQAEGVRQLQAQTLTALQECADGFAAALAESSRTKAAKHKASQALNRALDELKIEIRTLWADVRRDVRSGRQPTALLLLYHLPLSGKAKFPTSRPGWLDLGRRLVLGDAQAVEAGHPSARNAPALRAAYEDANAAATVHSQAALIARQAQAEKLHQRRRASHLCRALARELRLVLLGWDRTAQTQEMRRYGIRFVEESTTGPADSSRSLSSAAEAEVAGWEVSAGEEPTAASEEEEAAEEPGASPPERLLQAES